MSPASPREAMEHGIVYVPEERRSQGLVLPFPIAANITLGVLERLTRLGFVSGGAERQTAGRLSDELGIRGARISEPASRLSGGNQQKVVLAESLAQAPQVLLLDEPTRGVDVGAKSEIYRIVDGLAREGKAILLISSELEEVLSMSDRVVVMRQGRVTAELSRADATQEARDGGGDGRRGARGVTGASVGLRGGAVRATGVRRFLLRPEAPALLLFLLALVVVFSLTADSFLSPGNLEAIVVQAAVLGMIALAVNQVVLCGEIDISVGSMLGLCAVAVGTVAQAGGGLALPLLAGVLVGTAAGP